MPSSSTDPQKSAHFNIPFDRLVRITCGLPVFATFFCVVWSLIFNFQASTRTHCGVPNFLPTISAAIGGFTIQRFVWRVCIALHCAPRFMFACAYYNYHTSIHVGQKNQTYKGLSAICLGMNVIENLSLIGLSFMSSTENFNVHKYFFILFMFFGLCYMLLSTCVFSWGRTANGKTMSHLELKSLRYKSSLFITNISIFLICLYMYYRHNTYCEQGVYSVFALCEYVVVLTNIGFHGCMVFDFHNVDLMAIHQPDQSRFTSSKDSSFYHV